MRTALALLGAGALLLAGCSSDAPEPDVDPDALTLTIGHCAVEPVEYRGRTYDVVPTDQFGEADIGSEKYSGTGYVRAASQSWLIYKDDSGGKLVMRAERANSTSETTLCR